MKKIILLLLSTMMLLSCSQKHPKNTLILETFDKKSEKLVTAIKASQSNILMFDYTVDDSFKNMDIWVDVYEDGKKLESNFLDISVDINSNENKSGTFSIFINNQRGTNFSVTKFENLGNSGTYGGTPLEIDKKYTSSASGTLVEPALIEDNKEIVLFSSSFGSGTTTKSYSGEAIDRNPELIKDFEFIYFIKCKFTK